VVLLLEHSDEGSFGFIVNRTTELRMADLLADLGIAWNGDATAVARFGGPVHPNLGTAVFGEIELPDEAAPEKVIAVAPGLRLSQDIHVLTRLAESSPADFRLVLGSAGWGPGQLLAEVERNDWLVAPFDRELVFEEDETGKWERALASIGVRPESLPSMIGGDDDAN
jgi:putative transcriptional regulator